MFPRQVVTGSIPVVLVVCPGRLMVGCWSAKPTVRVPFPPGRSANGNANANNSRPGLQTLQCSDLRQSPKLITWYMRVPFGNAGANDSCHCYQMHRWCNGNTTVSKTVVLGSSPSLCVSGAVGKLVKPQVFQSWGKRVQLPSALPHGSAHLLV